MIHPDRHPLAGLVPSAAAAPFPQENALALARVARDAYLDPDELHGRFEGDGWTWRFIENHKTDTQLYAFCNGHLAVLAFRGTEPGKVKDWLRDLRFAKVKVDDRAKAHGGFYLGWQSVAEEVLSFLLENGGVPVFLTGHSLGGALAALAGYHLTRFLDMDPHLYTFGQPRVGNDVLAEGLPANYFRITNNNDVVPRVPPWLLGFRHGGIPVHLTVDGRILIDPGICEVTCDRLRGRGREPVGDSITDHSMDDYVRLLEGL